MKCDWLFNRLTTHVHCRLVIRKWRSRHEIVTCTDHNPSLLTAPPGKKEDNVFGDGGHFTFQDNGSDPQEGTVDEQADEF